MWKLILLLCLALATCQPTGATSWHFSSGERSSGPNTGYIELPSISNYDQYVANQQVSGEYTQQQLGELDLQQQQQQQQQQVVVEQKTNPGTKGTLGRIFNRKPTQPQQQQQQFSSAASATIFASHPDQILSYGHVELSPTYQAPANLTESKSKVTGLRAILPWNWVFSSPATQTGTQKRFWNPFNRQAAVSNRQTQTQYCPCQPYIPNYVPVQPSPYPTANYGTYYPQQQQPQQYSSDPASESNVRPVEPSHDFQGESSNPIPNIVPAPSRISDTQQQPQQGQLPSGAVDQLVAHQVGSSQQQQQMAPQAASYAPYQGSASPYSGNSNTPSAPVATNYQSSTGEVAQNGQQVTGGN